MNDKRQLPRYLRPLFLSACSLMVLAARPAEAAGATDMTALCARLPAYDHAWMMFTSVAALLQSEREYLEPELELLVMLYTTIPDQNWSNQGEWGGWSGFPDEGRSPNNRREWQISQACGYSPVSRQGKPLYLHGPPGSYEAVRVLFPRIVRLFKEGKHGEAMRVLGAMSHAIQDSATFPHMQAMHRVSSFRFSEMDIPRYQPIKLGDTPEKAAEELAKRTERMVHFTEKVSIEIRDAMSRGDLEKNSALRVKCCNEAAKVVADAIHTAILLAGPKPEMPQPPAGTNLIPNGNVEEADFGEPWPAGWVAHWNDPLDRLGRIEWEGIINHNQNLRHSGRYSLKLMWAGERGIQWHQSWPAAVWVKPGQRYRATAWVKTVKTTGKTDIAMEFATRSAKRVTLVRGSSMAGERDWTQLSVEAAAQPRAERLRLVLCSRSNEGAAWFDDIALVRVDPHKKTPAKSPPVKKAKPAREDRMLWLTFDEGRGTHVRDRSPYTGINGPNLLASGGVPCSLYTSKGAKGAAVGFDGKDDFVECPFSYIQDVQCPEDAMTLMLQVWAEDHRDAVLVAKQQRIANQPARGYALRSGTDGRVRFTIHTDRGPATAESADKLPLRRWAQVIATRTPDNQLTVYIDGRPGTAQKAPGKFLPSTSTKVGFGASLYLGADTGVRDFFAGRLDEFLLLNRALDAAEVGK